MSLRPLTMDCICFSVNVPDGRRITQFTFGLPAFRLDISHPHALKLAAVGVASR